MMSRDELRRLIAGATGTGQNIFMKPFAAEHLGCKNRYWFVAEMVPDMLNDGILRLGN